MFGVKLICVGKLKEKFFFDAVSEYSKRLGAYCHLDITELNETRLPDNPSDGEISAALSKEAEAIRACIPKGSAIIAMCIEGKEFSSEELAVLFERMAGNGISKLCFIIGGSWGLDSMLKNEASVCLSMSQMTFPHHLARIMLLEQIYRAFNISSGGKYHK